MRKSTIVLLLLLSGNVGANSLDNLDKEAQLLLSGSVGTNSLDNLDKDAESQAQWDVSYGDDNCFMQVVVRYNEGSARARERAGLGVYYNLKNKNVNYIIFFLPAGVDAEAGLTIRFLDFIPDGDTYNLVPSQDGFIELPINDCNEEYCASRVHPEIQSEDHSKINLLEELMSREYVWLLFMRNGNAERAMIPIYKFRDEFSKINKKNESNIGVPRTSQEPLRP
jgi:hypothetical protein